MNGRELWGSTGQKTARKNWYLIYDEICIASCRHFTNMAEGIVEGPPNYPKYPSRVYSELIPELTCATISLHSNRRSSSQSLPVPVIGFLDRSCFATDAETHDREGCVAIVGSPDAGKRRHGHLGFRLQRYRDRRGIVDLKMLPNSLW
jgi:hypothetical protein